MDSQPLNRDTISPPEPQVSPRPHKLKEGDFPAFEGEPLDPSVHAFLSVVALIALFAPALRIVAQPHPPPAPQFRPAPRPLRSPPIRLFGAGPSAGRSPSQARSGNFTATSPTKEMVDAFLIANCGWDENRMWQVQAI